MIGFFGIVVPHLMRLMVGSDHRVEYCNAAYGEYLRLAPDAVAGAATGFAKR